MVAVDVAWVGVGVINDSDLSEWSKRSYRTRWRSWVRWCSEAGVEPLGATCDDVLRWLGPGERSNEQVRTTRKAVNFVYQALGMSSPFRERRVLAAVFGDVRADRSGEGYCERNRQVHSRRVRDYLIWCEQQGRSPFPGGGEQVSDFLWWLYENVGESTVGLGSSGVSRYLESNGYPGTSHHPAVEAVLRDARALKKAGGGIGKATTSLGKVRRRDRYQVDWIEWCEGQSIAWRDAGPEDALRYLRGLEGQRTSGERVFHLSALYEDGKDPFASESVLEWKRLKLRETKYGKAPGVRHGERVAEVMRQVRETRVVDPDDVPVGLTLEEVQSLEDDVDERYTARMWKQHANHWCHFEDWLHDRGLSSEVAVGQHVARYAREYAPGRLWVTVDHMVTSLGTMFDELKFEANPARSVEVERFLRKLKRERRESPSQVCAFRETDYQAMVAYAELVCEGGGSAVDELNALMSVALCGVMFDGMLRRKEVASVTWEDLSEADDGSGRLAIPEPKNYAYGEFPVVYVSRRVMVSLRRYREVRDRLGRTRAGDRRIFQLAPEALAYRLKAGFLAAGLDGDLTSRSLRIGMAQELAIAGFGLVLIMQAGRWASSSMPAYYIRGLQVDEMAVARLHRLMKEGRREVDLEMRGDDVLSTYEFVRLGN